MKGSRRGLVAPAVGIVLVLALIVAPVAADTMIQEDTTNRLGEDYTSLGLGTAGYDGTAESCSANCLSQPSCNAATFVEWDQSCWLKEIVPPATSESGMTSFVRQKTTPVIPITTTAPPVVSTVPVTTKAPGFGVILTILGCLGLMVIRKTMR